MKKVDMFCTCTHIRSQPFGERAACVCVCVCERVSEIERHGASGLLWVKFKIAVSSINVLYTTSTAVPRINLASCHDFEPESDEAPSHLIRSSPPH
jgi:hypothetical protein